MAKSKGRGRLRRPSSIALRMACAASATLVFGCSDPTPGVPAAAPSAACRASMGEAQALWDPLHSGAGGYGDTPSLAAPPSLYLTAWSLQLAAATRTATPAIDRATVVGWLTAGASDPARFANDTDLTPLARIQLAISTLKAITAPVPAGAAGAVESLRSGGLYREAATSTPSWPATALAVHTLADTDSAVPPQVLQNAKAQAAALKPTLGLKDIGESGLPILTILVLSQPAQATAALVPNLPALLRSWSDTIKAAGPSALTVGDLSDIHQLARAAGIKPPEVQPSFFTPLRTADGYYGLDHATSVGDPQVTYDAITIGAPVLSQVRTTLSLRQVRNGWLADESTPTAVDTYQAAVIDTLCGSTSHHPLSSQLLTTWIATATSPGTGQPALQAGSSATLAEACWLARDRQIALPASALQAEERTLTAQLRHDANLPAAGRDLAAADACGVTLPTALLATLPRNLAATTPTTMADALSLYLAAASLDDERLATLARAAAAKLRTASSAYRYNAQAPTADIVSTAEGFVICSPPGPTIRTRVLTQFSTPSGPALSPPAVGADSSTLTVSMASLSAAAILDTGTADPRYLL